MKKILVIASFFLTFNSFASDVSTKISTKSTLSEYCSSKNLEFISDIKITGIFGALEKHAKPATLLGGITVTRSDGAKKYYYIGKDDYFLFNVAKSAQFIRDKVDICVENKDNSPNETYYHVIGVELK